MVYELKVIINLGSCGPFSKARLLGRAALNGRRKAMMLESDLAAAATPSPSQLIAHMEQVTESERLRLARTLHDDLGGKLVALLMELAWVEQQLGTAS
jgi:signal transduction histidine kinase